jgi:hypothetical protein
MAVDKFSISLPEGLLAEVDEIALADGTNRSSVLREAAAEYVASRKAADRDEIRRQRVGTALHGFDGLAAEWGPDATTSLEYLAQIRGEGVAPAAESRPKRSGGSA